MFSGLEMPEIQLRPHQQAILRYRGGKLGIAAVPGSGKTWTLSLLAAEIIARGDLEDGQEVLIVTLVNSAVDNFSQRISSFLKMRQLLPNVGYRVRTLHGLAHDIVRQRPDLLGLDEQFTILDEPSARDILHEAALAWLRSHPGELDAYLADDIRPEKLDRIRREDLPKLVEDVAVQVIRTAKDLRLAPEGLAAALRSLPAPLPLAELGCQIYADYQRALAYRAAVDFDDLIQLALRLLELDPHYLERLQRTWPYILEDEAQDSSRLQEQILRTLVGEGGRSAGRGNWVRVGDPNQAIYETFTTASPEHLRRFLVEPDVQRLELPVSGRSTPSILALANYLVDWTRQAHPTPEVRDALAAPPWIEPAPPDDPQPNPEDAPDRIFLIKKRYTSEAEVQAVVESLARWLPDHADWTVAVLAPTQRHGFKIVEALQARGLPYESSLLSSSHATRQAAGRLSRVLGWMADPDSPARLAEAWDAWLEAQIEHAQEAAGETEAAGDQDLEAARLRLQHLYRVEDFLQPDPGRDWLEATGWRQDEPEIYTALERFRQDLQRWQLAALLPVDQLTLALAPELFHRPADLALLHKLAGALRQASQEHPEWRLPELRRELEQITKNERKLVGFSDEDSGFDPERYRGRVVVSTMHKAKGLEWDRVYLTSVNTYDFPSGLVGEHYIAEKWFLRNHLNLPAEALAQLRLVAGGATDPFGEWYQEGQATVAARLDYVRERLRLFYVGVTRARRELVITWNTGTREPLTLSQPLAALIGYWADTHPPDDTPSPQEAA